MNDYGYEVLLDVSKSGKERNWKRHKTDSLLLSESFKRLKRYSKAERVQNCGSVLKFHVCQHGHEKRLTWASFCRVRLCPMCMWRKSLLNAHQIRLVAHEAAQRQNLRWLFLTLTCKNVSGGELSEQITTLMKAWAKLSKRKEFKRAVVGWFRAFEVTRNAETGEYHPHFHVLLAVAPHYFKGRDYITQSQWVAMWQDCLAVDYTPVVDIRRVKGKRNPEKEAEILKAKGIQVDVDGTVVEETLQPSVVAELAKYSTKSKDYLVYDKGRLDKETTDEVVRVLDDSLAHRRLHAYGGLLKEVYKELEASGAVTDVEDDKADLIHVDGQPNQCRCSVCQSDMVEELYRWIPDRRNYIKKEDVSTAK